MKSVITADIINYSGLTSHQGDLVLSRVHALFDTLGSLRNNMDDRFSIRRGDNIQMELSVPGEALRVALLLRSAINSIVPGHRQGKRIPTLQVRIAIGIGGVTAERSSVDESAGEAYTLSGRLLDRMKENKRYLAIRTGDENINRELDTECRLLEVILSNWQVSSAEVIYWTLLGYTEKKTAEKLGISQPAVNQRKKNAGWFAIEGMLERFEELTDILEKKSKK